jgi:hypothetical protein
MPKPAIEAAAMLVTFALQMHLLNSMTGARDEGLSVVHRDVYPFQQLELPPIRWTVSGLSAHEARACFFS